MRSPSARVLVLRRSVCALASLSLLACIDPGRASAQCNSDLERQIRGFRVASEAIINAARKDSLKAGRLTQRAANDVLNDNAHFGNAAVEAGPRGACIIEGMQRFRAEANTILPKGDDTATVPMQTFQRAVETASARIIAANASLTDRVGVVFGFGLSGLVYDRNDNQTFKIVKQDGKDHAVLESSSSTLPIAQTGLLARFRDRGSLVPTSGSRHRARWRWMDVLVPTAAFGSLQFAGGQSGSPVNGTALGLGWQIVGDVHLMLGYSAERRTTLRKDLREQWENPTIQDGKTVREAEAPLPLGEGETTETIRGTVTTNAIVVVLGVPIGLKSFFGTS